MAEGEQSTGAPPKLAGAGEPKTVNRNDLPDEEFATMLASAIEGTTNPDKTPTPLGQAVFTVVLEATRIERQRCAGVLQAASARGQRDAESTAGRAALEINPNARKGLAIEAQSKMAGASLMQMAAMLISRPPGSCKRCGGTKQVPSQLAPGAAVPCPACAETSS